jgi:hypothetical protein
VSARQQPVDGLDVLGERGLILLTFGARQLDALVACGIRDDAGVVEQHRERVDALLDRLARVPRRCERRDELGHVVGGKLVRGSIAEHA